LKQLNTFYSTFFYKVNWDTFILVDIWHPEIFLLSPSISDPECLRPSEQRNSWIKCWEREKERD